MIFRSLIFVFCFTVSSVIAQTFEIKGKAPAHVSKEIKAVGFKDLITYSEKTLAIDTVKKDSTFHFSIQTNSPTQCIFLKIGNLEAKMYVEAGKSYDVFFPERDSLRFPNPSVKQSLDLVIYKLDSLDINSLVIDFNDRFNSFYEKNYQKFVMQRAKTVLDSFKVATLKHYENNPNVYFKGYLNYTFAMIEYNTFGGQKMLAKSYILNKQILYSNYEYMEFFNTFFKQYVRYIGVSKDGEAMKKQINETTNWQGVNEVLKLDKFLGNDTLRELVALKGMKELYYLNEYRQDNVVSIIEQIQKSSKIAEHQLIAENILNSFKVLKMGVKAPEFELYDRNGKLVSLKDFEGKYVYLDFWATWCGPCISEMKLISELKKKYGDRIAFVSISTDKDVETMKKFLSKNKQYDWTFLHYANNPNIQKEYGVYSMPYYFLINPQGNFLKYPAPMPSENIEPYLKQLMNKK